MNDFQLCQIYHVARCGSTLLAALVSSAADTYSEPRWAHSLNNASEIPEDLYQYHGSIVKFSSITTSIGFKPEGPKVFLYRPLSQYLEKMDQCGRPWLEVRKQIYGPVFDRICGTALKDLYPENAMQLHAIFWASCVIEMQKTEDVLWIKSNDFFADKEATATQVLAHFGKDGDPDMRFASVNVKKLGLNSTIIQPLQYYIDNNFEVEAVTKSHGIIENQSEEYQEELEKTLKWAKIYIPVDEEHFY